MKLIVIIGAIVTLGERISAIFGQMQRLDSACFDLSPSAAPPPPEANCNTSDVNLIIEGTTAYGPSPRSPTNVERLRVACSDSCQVKVIMVNHPLKCHRIIAFADAIA